MGVAGREKGGGQRKAKSEASSITLQVECLPLPSRKTALPSKVADPEFELAKSCSLRSIPQTSFLGKTLKLQKPVK